MFILRSAYFQLLVIQQLQRYSSKSMVVIAERSFWIVLKWNTTFCYTVRTLHASNINFYNNIIVIASKHGRLVKKRTTETLTLHVHCTAVSILIKKRHSQTMLQHNFTFPDMEYPVGSLVVLKDCMFYGFSDYEYRGDPYMVVGTTTISTASIHAVGICRSTYEASIYRSLKCNCTQKMPQCTPHDGR